VSTAFVDFCDLLERFLAKDFVQSKGWTALYAERIANCRVRAQIRANPVDGT
jgi:hypothetical protein